MRPAALPESQRANFASLLFEEIRREQEDEGVNPEEAFSRVALKTYGFDPEDGYHTDGAYDCGFDFVNVTQEETSIFQAKSLEFQNVIPIDAHLNATYLGDLRRILEVLHNLDEIPREANSIVAEALTSMRTEINRRALIPTVATEAVSSDLNVLDQLTEYRVNIYFFGLAKGLTAQAEEEFARFEKVPPIKYGKVLLTVSSTSCVHR